jgi:hypothetical protein
MGLCDHIQVHHSWYEFSGQVISPTHRPLPDNSQESQEINMQSPCGIQTSIPSERLRLRGHWDRPLRETFNTQTSTKCGQNPYYSDIEYVVHNSYHCVLKGVSYQYDSRILFLTLPVHPVDCLPTNLCTCMNGVAYCADYTSNPPQSRLFYCFGWHAPLTQFLVVMRVIQCQCSVFLSLTTAMCLVEHSCKFRQIILSSSFEFLHKKVKFNALQ